MFEASYGFPAKKAEDVVWVTAEEFIAQQGVDDESWTVKPYCPHCKVALRLYDAAGSQDFYLHSMNEDIMPEAIKGLARAHIGFAHLPKTAKADCPYSFLGNPLAPRYSPRYDYSKYVSRKTGPRERKRNVEVLREQKMARYLRELTRAFMQPLTGDRKISPEHKKIIKRITARKIIHKRGLATYPWLLPYMQVILFGAVLRINPPARPRKAKTEITRRMPPRLRAWRPGPIHKLSYISVNGEPRNIDAPRFMELCWVYKRPVGVSYVPMKNDGKPIIFNVSREWAHGHFVRRNRARWNDTKKLTKKYRPHNLKIKAAAAQHVLF